MTNADPLTVQTKLKTLETFKSFEKAPYFSTKHSSYFQVYEDLFTKYRGKPLTFVEVGVFQGGSLFMWRDFFGPQARIIGVDLNPIAKRWEKEGFEIYVGSQSDPKFWQDFFEKVGKVDIVLDDGGHTFEQQIMTAVHCIPQINDDGLMVVEDTHTSYFVGFGYPSKYSFIEWTKKIIDNINSRFPRVNISKQNYKNYVYSVTAYESIVCFHIDRTKCFNSFPVSNEAPTVGAEDFRNKGTIIQTLLDLQYNEKYPLFFRKLQIPFFKLVRFIRTKVILFGLRKYF